MKKNVLLLETIADEAFQLLQENANVFPVYENISQEEIFKAEQIQAIITRGKGQVNFALMEAAPHLTVVARCGVGLDNIDVKEATKRNIKVINAPGSNSGTIAEHTISLMLMLIRNMYISVAKVKQGDWNWRNQYVGDELNGKTLGIIGMGNIGKRVARLGEAFGMNIIYWDKFQVAQQYRSLSMDEVLREADLISLHVPLFEDTYHLIGERELSLIKSQAFLINTARGGLIDQKALINALNQQKIAGFGADVLAEEPPEANDPLLNHPRTNITAHVGSLTAATYKYMCLSTVKNVLAILSGQDPEPESIFNRKALNL
jgi:D-3-phosphoglycerate dehydrogenase